MPGFRETSASLFTSMPPQYVPGFSVCVPLLIERFVYVQLCEKLGIVKYPSGSLAAVTPVVGVGVGVSAQPV